MEPFPVHRSHDLVPACDLRGSENTRSPKVALPLLRDLRSFADDEPRASALRIVLDVQILRHLAFTGTRARQRCHDNSVLECEGAELERFEKFFLHAF